MLFSSSEDATLALGSAIAGFLGFGDTVALYGDLGAGKTVLSRGVARGLGIVAPVTSPTFTVVQEYGLPGGGFFFHLDMYRIDGEEAALAFGIEDFLFAKDAISLVEWPERIEGLLGGMGVIPFRLAHSDHDVRTIELPQWLEQKLVNAGLPDGIVQN